MSAAASGGPDFSSRGQAAAPFKEPHWRAPLVNRVQELANLGNSLQDALSSKSYLVALEGEAGIGKTRLCRELTSQAHSMGVTVLSGRAIEDLSPYGPWVQLLTEASAQGSGDVLLGRLGLQPSQTGTFMPKIPETFARLVPQITEKLGTISLSKPLEAQQDRIRLYETITQFFIAMSKEHSLVVFLDDMQWSDAPTLSLLEYFIRSTRNFRILTLLCYRTEETQPESPLQKTLMSLNRERLLKVLRVGNLDKEDTANLIKQIFGETGVSGEFADVIYDRTGGNPFFVEEVLRSLVEQGAIFRTETKWDRKPIQELTIPESVKATLRSRLTKLEAGVVSVLSVAAVTGSEFDFAVLREVTQTQEDMLLQRLEAAISAGLIAEVPRCKDVFRFADNRIRELLLGDLSQSRRARYHVKVGDAIEKVYSKNLDSRAEDLAFHFSEGGDNGRGIGYSIRAGDRNRVVHAYEQAISDYKRALDLIELERGKDEEKAVIYEKLGQCCRYAAHLQESIRCFEQAVAIFEKLHDFKSCARVTEELTWPVMHSKGYRESILVARQALKYVEETPESYEAAGIYSQLANCLATMDEFDEADGWCRRALEAGEKSGNYAAVSQALANMGTNLADTGRIDEGLPLLEKSLEIALQRDQYQPAIFGLLHLALYTYPRNLPKAREYAARWHDLAKRENAVWGQANSLVQLSIHDRLAGNWALALEETSRAFEMKERTGVTLDMCVAEARRGLLHLGFGDLEQAEKYLQLALAGQPTKITGIVETNLGLGLLRLEQGREEDAKTHFETCANAFKPAEFTTDPLLHVQSLLHLTSIYAKEARLEEARKTSDWAKRLAETLKSDAGLAMASQAEGSLLLHRGDRKASEEAYLKSLALWEKAGWPYYRAKALMDYSEAMAQTNPEESRRRLEQAAEIFRKLGAKRDLEKAETKLTAQA